ncbi:MAG: hypothetical protein ABW202_18620 [Duganella sp.]
MNKLDKGANGWNRKTCHWRPWQPGWPQQLESEHGRGFGAKNLRHMLRFGEIFASEEIVYALRRQLS